MGAAHLSPERRHERDALDGQRRYYDPHIKGTVVKVLPGEHYVTEYPDEVLVTVLGSCVSACIRDTLVPVGGMNHFMLPGEARGRWGEATHEMRYGQFAMEQLINDVLKRGARRDRLEVKLFGGANVIRSSLNIGTSNAEFVRSFMRAEQLKIAAEDLGGDYPRRIHYFPLTGKVQRLEMRRDPDRVVFDSELRYRDRLREQPVDGDVELFT
ncbi:MAG TPA: chemoreceptor glutamine deamidase CheD [Candidatus Sulfotelmatobacter sp.]|nr:chemoreceptor glutamine deamidase CheD [Candidatus Sulfotelmatobacter sp.]